MFIPLGMKSFLIENECVVHNLVHKDFIWAIT